MMSDKKYIENIHAALNVMLADIDNLDMEVALINLISEIQERL
jgi:hypothetical protein